MIDPAHVGVAAVVLEPAHAFAVDEYVAAVHGDGAAENVQKRGLAAAVAAYDGDKLPGLHRQGKMVEQPLLGHGAGVIDLGDVPDLKHG